MPNQKRYILIEVDHPENMEGYLFLDDMIKQVVEERTIAHVSSMVVSDNKAIIRNCGILRD